MTASLVVAFAGMLVLKDYTGMAVAQLSTPVSYGVGVALMLGFVVLLESARLIYEH